VCSTESSFSPFILDDKKLLSRKGTEPIKEVSMIHAASNKIPQTSVHLRLREKVHQTLLFAANPKLSLRAQHRQRDARDQRNTGIAAWPRMLSLLTLGLAMSLSKASSNLATVRFFELLLL
jgi:hypothetical protein